MTMRILRRWHRWVGWTAAIFLLWASSTGVLVAGQEFFGADEAERERLRETTSSVRLDATATEIDVELDRALATAAAKSPGAPVDKVELKLKGDAPVVTVFLGKPGGGEDKLYRIDAKTGALLSEEAYADKPLLYRLHSGEAFGDGGLVGAMLWGLALVVMTVTGGWMYVHMMRRRTATGWRRVYW